ncbi:MAG TPA: arylesterase [Alphaproteobacteria bacterium]|jgi:acyl-CoA thioesterase-1
MAAGAFRPLILARLLALLALLLTAGMPGASAAEGKPVTILAFGDSLVAGYGLGGSEGFTAKLEAALKAKGIAARVVNAGLSGDTSAGGLARLDWALEPKPDFAIVELGANDGLRGLDPAQTRANLDAILTKLKAKGVGVLFVGMYAPPNMGPDYGNAFNALYPELAAKHGVAFYPFFLDGVAANAALNQPDGIHPNAQGIGIIVERILPHVLRLIGKN